jgi:hypothetical protein
MYTPRFPETAVDYREVAPEDVALLLMEAMSKWEGNPATMVSAELALLTFDDHQEGGSLHEVTIALLNEVTAQLVPEHKFFRIYERFYLIGEPATIIQIVTRGAASATLAQRRLRNA